jgi:uncharacterized protein
VIRRLMEADRWIERVLSQKSHLPEIEELTGVEESLRRLASDLKSTTDDVAPLQRAFEAVRDEAERLGNRVRDLDASLTSSSASARDLSALQGELDNVRRLWNEAEDRELELMEQLEPLNERVAAIRREAQPLAVRRGELTALISDLQTSLDEEVVALRVSREEIAREMPADLLARYDSALRRAGTSGASIVDGGRCDGCRIALAPADLNRFKALGDDDLMVCPECGRLLLS